MNQKTFFGILILLIFVAASLGCNKSIKTSKQSNPVKIGATFPLTGNLAVYGQAYKNGVLMAQKEINLSKNYRVQIKFMDNQGDAKSVENDIKYLAKVEGVGAILNSFEYLSLASKASVENLGLPMLTFTTYKLTSQDNAKYTFRDYWDMGQIGKLFAKALNNINGHKLAIIAQNDSSYTHFKNNFTAHFKGQVVWEEKFLYGTKDFRTQLLRIQTTNMDTLIIYAFPVEASLILKQMSELNMDNYKLILTEGSEELVTQGNQAILQKTQAISYLGAELSQANREFIKQYKNTYGKHPRPDAFYAYEGVKLIAEISNKCQTQGVKELEEMRKCIQNQMLNYFDADHNKYRELPLVRYDDGWKLFTGAD